MVRFFAPLLFLLLLLIPSLSFSQELTKVAFPYGPLGLNSLPWVVAKQTRIFEKNSLDVDMVYIGASAVIVQSMLSGSANIAGFGGPAVITNVLRGGDIIQVAAMAPYFTQSVVVRSDIRDIKGLQGKKIGITRFGSVTDFAIRTLLERHNIKDVNILQMGGFPEAVAGIGARRDRWRGFIAAPRLSHDQRRISRTGCAQRSPRFGQRFYDSRDRRAQILRRHASRYRCPLDQIDGRRPRSLPSSNEDFTKRAIAKYLGITDPDFQRQSYQYIGGNFRPRAIRAGKHDAVDGAAHGPGQHDRRQIRAINSRPALTSIIVTSRN